MTRKYLFFIFILVTLLFLFSSETVTESNDTWVIKSKDPVFTIWMTGKITRGEPGEGTDSSGQTATLDGNQYYYGRKWFTRGNAVYCPWARKPIIYLLELESGGYRIGLSARNYASGDPDWTKPSGYTKFKVAVYVDNKRKGMLFIDASDTEINTEYLTVENIEAGVHDVKFLWTNDRYNPGRKQDANIEIHNVLFEKID